jgi:cytochrome P450
VTEERRICIDVDPFSPRSIEQAVAIDGAIREAAPLVWLEQYQMWASARHDVVKAILADWEGFSSAKRPFDHPDFPLPALLVTDDPPTHTPIRRLVGKILSPAAVQGMQEGFERTANRVVASALAQGQVEAVNDLVTPYILEAFGDAMGLTPRGRHHLAVFGAAILNTFGPPNDVFHAAVSKAGDAAMWVDEQCRRDALATGSVGSRLFEAAQEGDCDEQTAALLFRILLSAGVDTSVAIIANLIHGLAEHPDQWELLKSDPKLASGAFEEAHRWYSPSRMFGRVALRDANIADIQIAEGESVLLFVSATGRDGRVWEDPERFDITRSPGRHLSFGYGIHNCVGQMFARAEVAALVGALVSQIETIRPNGEPISLESNTIQSLSALPITMR